MSTQERNDSSEVTKLPANSGGDPNAVIIEHEPSTPPAFDPLITRRRAIVIGLGTLVAGTALSTILLESKNNTSNPNFPENSSTPDITQSLTPDSSTTPTLEHTPERIPGFLYPGDAIYRIEHPQNRLAITIDDCNNDEVIQEYLDLADEFAALGFPVSFTFFPTGMSAISYPQILNEIVKKGHEIGTHTLDHPFLTQLDGKSADPDKRTRQRTRLIKEEIKKGLEAIQSSLTIDYRVRFFRAPFGDGAAAGSPIDPDIKNVCRELGLVIAGWSSDSNDTSPGTYDARKENKAAQRMMNNIGKVEKGDIILFHANWPNSVDGVRKLLEKLMVEGKIKADRTLSEMVKFGDSIPTSGTIYESSTL